MSRVLTTGVAQLGPIVRDEGRTSVVARMCDLMSRAHAAKRCRNEHHGMICCQAGVEPIGE